MMSRRAEATPSRPRSRFPIAMVTLGACLFAAATDAATMLVTEVQGNVATEASARRLAPVVALETKM